MASKKEYAMYCLQLLEGDTHMTNQLWADLREDKFLCDNDEWVDYEDDE